MPLLLLLLLLAAASCWAGEMSRPSYASVVAGTHKRPGSEQAKIPPAEGGGANLGQRRGPAASSPPLKQEDIANAATRFSLEVTKVRGGWGLGAGGWGRRGGCAAAVRGPFAEERDTQSEKEFYQPFCVFR